MSGMNDGMMLILVAILVVVQLLDREVMSMVRTITLRRVSLRVISLT